MVMSLVPMAAPSAPRARAAARPSAVRDAACCYDGDGDRIRNARHEAEGGGISAVGRRLMARHEQRIAPVVLGAFGVLVIDDRCHDLAAIFMGSLHDPVAFAQGEVDDRNLFFECHSRIVGGTGEEEGGVGAEGFVR
ncbi:MAG: hypothetical protein MZV63_57670 [Marinilabiliales bacterium]|nr:hypothetical protein [Marinilabiliales bacterium]